MNKTAKALLVPFAALILLGAGCAQKGTDAVQQDMNNEPTAADTNADQPSETSGTQTPPLVPTDETKPAPTPAAQPVPTDEQKPARPTVFPGVLPVKQLQGDRVHIVTPKGEIVFELLPEAGPKAASNFYALAKSGFFDGLTFHRVVPGFVIQGGDPQGDGTGGPGYTFEDDPVTLDYKAGVVAMANRGPDTNGSQFFIVLADEPTLPKSYSVFGRVVSGMEVVNKIVMGDVMTSVFVEESAKK